MATAAVGKAKEFLAELNNSEAMSKHFQDNEDSFSQNKFEPSPYLIAFLTICFTLTKRYGKCKTTHREKSCFGIF